MRDPVRGCEGVALNRQNCDGVKHFLGQNLQRCGEKMLYLEAVRVIIIVLVGRRVTKTIFRDFCQLT